MITEPKYGIVVQLSGMDGNVFSIIGRVRKELRRNGVSDEVIGEFTDEVIGEFINECNKADSYDVVLRIVMNWVVVK